jgi:cold shock protein
MGTRALTHSESAAIQMTNGTVKFFNATRGYGFISPEDGSKDIFVHISAVQKSGLTGLNEGQKVQFDVQPDDRGPKAINLVEL